MQEETEADLEIFTTFKGKTITISLSQCSTIGDLKEELYQHTNVLPKRQKLIGLTKGKQPGDSLSLSSLQLKKRTKIIFVGTAEENILKRPSITEMPVVLDDLDFDYCPSITDSFIESKQKLSEAIDKAQLHLISQPRQGKKLLVLDIDHTVMDFSNKHLPVEDMKRPGLEEFLEAVYPFYDIAFWSQTSWSWLEIKLTEMGILTNPKYAIIFVLDKTVMFRVKTNRKTKDGKKYSHHVKPLEIIWCKMPAYYNKRNTIHIDDLSRNFAYNPLNGIKISAYRTQMISTDRELYLLAKYLLSISPLDDLTSVSHNDWRAKALN